MDGKRKGLIGLSVLSSAVYIVDQIRFVRDAEATNKTLTVKGTVVGLNAGLTVLLWYLKKKKVAKSQNGTTNSEGLNSRYFTQGSPSKRGLLHIKDKFKGNKESSETEARTYSGPVTGPEVLERITLQGQAKINHLLRGRGYPREQIIRLLDEFVDNRAFDVQSYLDRQTLTELKQDLHEYLYQQA